VQTNMTMDFCNANESWADASLLTTQRGPSMFESMATEMLDLCWKVVAHRRFVKGFVFATGIMPPLWCILVMARKRELLVGVVELFREIVPRKEGYWNSVTCLQTAEGVLAKWDMDHAEA
jgi:hypothetical protein